MEILAYTLIALQCLTGVCLIALVLFHSPKGDGIAGIGSSAQMFSSPRGAEEGLNKLTMYVIGVFFLLAFVNGYYTQNLLGGQ